MDDAFYDPVDGLPPVLDVSEQVNGGSHLLLDEVASLFRRPVAAQKRLHVAADSQARAAVVGKIYLVLALNLFDEDFWDDEYRFFGRVAATGVRVELAYVLKLFDEVFNFNADLL